MPKIAYISRRFKPETVVAIEQANEIIREYQAAGYTLTLRQLYYQHVARALIPNTVRAYKRLGSIVSDGRLAGLIDWSAIEDRTREIDVPPHWRSPAEIIEACAREFALDKWLGQRRRVEVWVEKDALTGVFEPACKTMHVGLFACKGYVSQSEMWGAVERRWERFGSEVEEVVVLHFGDHDPSGIDMTRDIEDRLTMFSRSASYQVKVERVALNMSQVEEYQPPPNPAKVTDSRAADYISRFGRESWELDALDPPVLEALTSEHIDANIEDLGAWKDRCADERRDRRLLRETSDRWAELRDYLGGPVTF
ncbi:MAG: hypothetical protein ACYTG0_12605 [Planctomycetota bacterium]|jgi:hypothetical protein